MSTLATQPNKELRDFLRSFGKLRMHLVADLEGKALLTNALSSLCCYYNSDSVAGGRLVIKDVLNKHPHLHCAETRVENRGFEVSVSCDNCGKAETTSHVARYAVDIAAAVMLGMHAACKPANRKDRTWS